MPDQITREICRQRPGIDHRCNRIRGVVKTVHELEGKRDQERDEEQDEWEKCGDPHPGRVHVDIDAVGNEQQRRRNDPHEYDAGQRMDTAVEIGTLSPCWLDQTR